METIKRRIAGVEKFCEVYAPGEKLPEGINPKPWRECFPGDWGITDDGYVAQCIARKPTYVVLTCGPGALVKSGNTSKILFEQRKANRNFSSFDGRPWIEHEARKKRTKLVVMRYAAMVVNRQPINWEELGKLYRPEQAVPEATVRRLFKQERIQTMVKDEIREIMRNLGMTEQSALEVLRDSIDIARTKKNPFALQAAYDRMESLLGMNPKEKIVGKFEASITKELEQSIFKAERELELEAPATPPALPTAEAVSELKVKE